FSIRARVSGATRSGIRSTRLTVIDDTPARLATADRVGAASSGPIWVRGDSELMGANLHDSGLPIHNVSASIVNVSANISRGSANILGRGQKRTRRGSDSMISDGMVQAYRRDGVIVVPEVLDNDI